MGSRCRQVMMFLIALLLCSSTSLAETPQSDEQGNQEGALNDVRIVPASCLSNASCIITQPAHLVEYFSADWCEPCEQVSTHLRTLDTNQTIVLQHHASPADQTFLSDSKVRFDQEYRLLFIPSLVVDGTHLLTGTRQATELNSLLNATAEPTTDLDSLTLTESNLSWDEQLDGVVRVWYAEPTPHTEIESIHPSLARSMIEVNASEGSVSLESINISDDGFFVVMLEAPGMKPLTVASDAPTGSMDLSETEEETSTQQSPAIEGYIVIGITLGLVMLLLPALGMHRSLMAISKQVPHDETLEEE